MSSSELAVDFCGPQLLDVLLVHGSAAVSVDHQGGAQDRHGIAVRTSIRRIQLGRHGGKQLGSVRDPGRRSCESDTSYKIPSLHDSSFLE